MLNLLFFHSFLFFNSLVLIIILIMHLVYSDSLNVWSPAGVSWRLEQFLLVCSFILIQFYQVTSIVYGLYHLLEIYFLNKCRCEHLTFCIGHAPTNKIGYWSSLTMSGVDSWVLKYGELREVQEIGQCSLGTLWNLWNSGC